jgi:hypothetical protein
VNVQLRFARLSPSVAVIDAEVPRHGWLSLDLERTLNGVLRSYGWPVGALRGHIKLEGSALSGPLGWREAAPALSSRSPTPSAPISVASHPVSNRAAQAPKPFPEPSPAPRQHEPQPRPARRIPDADIIFVGRRLKAAPREEPGITREPPDAADRSGPVPKIRAGVRPWLAVVAALAMVGVTFYCGTQWSRCHVIVAPTTLNGKTVIG